MPPPRRPHRTDLDLLVFYGIFAVLAAATLAAPLPVSTGWRAFALVVLHGTALPLLALARRHEDLTSLIAFIWPLSAFMLLPDWVLSTLLGTLSFPDDGAPRIDTMPLAMAGMWAIPLTVSTWMGHRAGRAGPLVAGGVGLGIFLGSELAAPWLGLWAPTDSVRTLWGVAPYVLPAEWILAVVTLRVWRRHGHEGVASRVHHAFLVALVYLGALAVGLLVVERWLPL